MIPATEAKLEVRTPKPGDRDVILALGDRLVAFGPTTRSAADVAARERRALAEALDAHDSLAELLVADVPDRGVVGVILVETRQDYFTGEGHGHVAILAVAADVEGRGIGRRLLGAAEQWARKRGYRRLTLSVFTENLRAKAFYAHEQWRPELETYYKLLEPPTDRSA